MRRFLRHLTLLACAALPLLTALPAQAGRAPLHAAPSASAEDPNGARVIVKYRVQGSMMRALSAGTGARRGPQMAAALGLRHGLTLTDGHVVNASTQVVFGGPGLSSAALAATLAADPEVDYAVPDLRRHALGLPNDPLYANWPASALAVPPGYTTGQWYLHAPDAMPAGGYTGASLIASIDAVGAWALTTGSASVIVADVDTGALYNHPDLAGKLLPGRNFVSTSSTATGAGWSADASDPGDYTTAGECGSGQAAQPSSWHGTQTSSIIGAATNNATGMAAVGYDVRVLPVRVLGPCGGYDSDIIAGMYWAAGLNDPNTGDPSVPVNPNPARIINMSLGGTGSCPAPYITAINDLTAAGVTVVVAAGNADGTNGSEIVGTPANCPGVIAVAGLRNVGTKVGYSALGSSVAIAAPAGNCVNTSGACIYPILTATDTSATTPGAGTYSYSDTANYALGTSFSTPMVAGTAALMLSVNPGLTPGQIKSMLQGSARPFPTTSAGEATQPAVCVQPTAQIYEGECICTTSTCGAGMLDAGNAVTMAAANAPPSVAIAASANPALEGNTVTLTGTATAPVTAVITSYQWTLTGGGTIAALSGTTNGAT
ncbi:MAG: S8 family serine peptidase, partial [Burkholderiales bacterium]|nr:S8 family serine peptidase [Burkholderiales bacterium]